VLINVSTLLEEPVGSVRRYVANTERVTVAEADYERTVDGSVALIRSDRGILVHAELHTIAALECGRCLEPVEEVLTIVFDEEFVPERRPDTGLPTPDLKPEEFRIDEHRHLDLSEAVRQYEQSAIPLQPLCRADCAGLCPRCGQNLNQAQCDCPTDDTDDRWGALAGLADQLRDQEHD
jgi:uncharacterized protein